MKTPKSLYHHHSSPSGIIQYAVWLYHRFSLSFRDVEDLLAERGVTVSYETIRRVAYEIRSTLREPTAPEV